MHVYVCVCVLTSWCSTCGHVLQSQGLQQRDPLHPTEDPCPECVCVCLLEMRIHQCAFIKGLPVGGCIMNVLSMYESVYLYMCLFNHSVSIQWITVQYTAWYLSNRECHNTIKYKHTELKYGESQSHSTAVQWQDSSHYSALAHWARMWFTINTMKTTWYISMHLKHEPKAIHYQYNETIIGSVSLQPVTACFSINPGSLNITVSIQ